MILLGSFFFCLNIKAAQPLDKLVGKVRKGTVEVPPGNYFVDKLSIPDTVTLKIDNGAVIDIKNVLELNGVLDAGCYPVFAGPGKVIGNVKVERVYPQWFGAAGDGKHDDTEAIQRAADLAQLSSGGLLFVPPGRYRFHQTLDMRCDIDCKGVFIKEIEVDESRTEFSYATFCNGHFLKNVYGVHFVPDSDPLLLSPPRLPASRKMTSRSPSSNPSRFWSDREPSI